MKRCTDLTLADGTCWSIQACDDETAKIVAQLGSAMMLKPGRGLGHRLLVKADGASPAADKVPSTQDQDPVVCVLPTPCGKDTLAIQMMNASLVIARDAQTRGGVLLHGALAEWNGRGIILAGSGDVGKTTASSRLPVHWHSLCDDTTLAVKDRKGRYWAHPWPTWSRFYQNGPGGSWDVQHAVPLEAIFILSQSCQDKVEPLNQAQAASLLMSSAQQVSGSMTRKLSDKDVYTLRKEQVAAVDGLVRAVPVQVLHISLTGNFWEEIEHELRKSGSGKPNPRAPIPVVYTGHSMNPTLEDGDLLEVVPYAAGSIQKGDVIYFQRARGRAVVHRVWAVTPQGIKTRGDNNRAEDPHTLQRADILGQVVAARRAWSHRKIPGGRHGTFVRGTNRLRRALASGCARMLSGPYRHLADKVTLRGVLPSKLRPRLVAFRTSRYREHYKIVVSGKEVGRYDNRERTWRIDPPFRLIVDESRLPRPERRHPGRPGRRAAVNENIRYERISGSEEAVRQSIAGNTRAFHKGFPQTGFGHADGRRSLSP
jgi:SynChlorMet cassette protein ScmC